MQEVHTVWLDTVGGKVYPVFDVKRGSGGRDGRYTYPDESRGAPTRDAGRRRPDGVLVGTAGHLHPGGLWTDLQLTRDGQHGAAVPLARRSTSSRPAPCRGTSR